MSTLADIETKVRRLTRRPSPQQITRDQVYQYVNDFYLYDMPENLRLFTNNTVFEFMTEANVATYDMETMTVWTGTENAPAVDVYINITPPVYIAGYQGFWSQSREQFFRIYPELAQISSTTEGDGSTGPYTLTFDSFPIIQESVTVGAIDSTGAVVNVIDVPTNRTTGTWQIINTNTSVTGSVTYTTGAVTVTFSNTIPSGNTITFTAVPYQASRPQALLFYDNIITLRPVPDQSYLVRVNAYKRATDLVSSGESPELRQWWQYLAYGAAKKIFEDSQDMDGVQAILPEYDAQERKALRRTLVQKTIQRSATIYTEMVDFPFGNFENKL